MPKRLARALSKKSTQSAQIVVGPWDEAVLEAQNQIDQVQQEAIQKIARLATAKRTLEDLRDSGAEFPRANNEVTA